MTRAQGPQVEIDVSSRGTPGAARTVVVLRTGSLASVDPDSAVTAARDVRLLLVHLDAPELDDPPAYGGETPAGSTAAALIALAGEEIGDAPFGLVAERDAAALGLSLAAALGDRVDRLALVAAPVPESPLQRDLAVPILGRVTAKTLVLASAGDPDAPQAAATWHRDHLADARLEMVPGTGDGRLALTDVWARVLSHTAPHTLRR